MQLIRKAMCANVFSVNMKSGVAVRPKGPSPAPTAVRILGFGGKFPEGINRRLAGIVACYEAIWLARLNPRSIISQLGDISKPTTAALTKMWAVKRKLDGFCYTCHVNASNTGVDRAGVVTATPGLYVVPNYTTFERSTQVQGRLDMEAA